MVPLFEHVRDWRGSSKAPGRFAVRWRTCRMIMKEPQMTNQGDPCLILNNCGFAGRGGVASAKPRWEWVWTVCSRNRKQAKCSWRELSKSEHAEVGGWRWSSVGWPTIPDCQGAGRALGCGTCGFKMGRVVGTLRQVGHPRQEPDYTRRGDQAREFGLASWCGRRAWVCFKQASPYGRSPWRLKSQLCVLWQVT